MNDAPWHRRVVIGDATLYLGGAREIVPTFSDGIADMIFTDPPYGHNNNDGDLISRWEGALGRKPSAEKAAPRPIANDGPEEAGALFEWLLAEAPRLLARGGCCCCCCPGGGGPDPQFARWALMMDQALEFKQMIVWDKGPMGMGWHYRRSYETVLVAQKPGVACKWYDTTDRIENIIRPGAYGVRKIIPQDTDHPTPKPPALAQHFIRLHTLIGETVLDPFMGAGSTGVAALREGRKFIGVELEERWFNLACKRIFDTERQPDMLHRVPTGMPPSLLMLPFEDKQ